MFNKSQESSWLLNEKYNGEKSEGFFTDCERLRSGEPLAYVIGSIPFLHTTIYLDSHPLIPRPETEFWVEKVITHMKSAPHRPLRILDLCSGSGAIGTTVLHAITDAHVTFAEIDPTHLPTIEKNILKNNIDNGSKRSTVVVSDLFEQIDGTFDFILTNPPYIDKKAFTVEKSVEDYEPSLALFGGDGGMEIIEKILLRTKAYLHAHGELWLEHEPSQVQHIQNLAKEYDLHVTVHNDQYGVARYSIFTMAQ